MQESLTYLYKGKEYPVSIIYKKKKNITYYFRNETFIITCPIYVSKKRIKEGLDKYAEKLIKRYENEKTALQDDRLFLFGEQLFFDDNTHELHFHNDIIKFNNRDDLIIKLKEIYKEMMISRTRYYENIMNVYPPYKIKIKAMKTRFGSNSKKTHTISYADNLFSYSIDILDSLVVHELAHHFAFDHSKNFYSIVLKYCPNYHKDNKKLKKRIFR